MPCLPLSGLCERSSFLSLANERVWSWRGSPVKPLPRRDSSWRVSVRGSRLKASRLSCDDAGPGLLLPLLFSVASARLWPSLE